MVRSTLRASQLARGSLWGLDLIGLIALMSCPEIHPGVFLIVTLLFILSRFKRIRFSNGLMIFFLILVVSGSAWLWLVSHFPASVAFAHGAPIFHSLLWLSSDKNRNTALRISMGFVELNLAATMATGLLLSLEIFTFAALAAASLSCNFLDRTIKQRDPKIDEVNLDARYIRSSIAISMSVLASSILIFMILPRTKGANFTFFGSTVGYTEEVSYDHKGPIGGEGGGSALLHLFFKTPAGSEATYDLSDIYLGLIRGRVLERFNGKRWSEAPSKGKNFQNPPFKKPLHAREMKTLPFDIVREPLGSGILPVPYGTRDLSLEIETSSLAIRHLATGEWMMPTGANSRVSYHLTAERVGSSIIVGSPVTDQPTEETLEVPESLKTKRMERLLAKLSPKGSEKADLPSAIVSYFSKEGFTPSLDASSEDGKIGKDLHPFERFLFLTKSGHCELYAGATAVLLRMAGIPARMIAGFRITRSPIGGVLTIRAGDAHAWIEYWTEDYGWKPLDPTPHLTGTTNVIDYVRERYEVMSAYWDKYVYSYDSGAQMALGSQAMEAVQNQASFSSWTWESTLGNLAQQYKTVLIWALGLILICGMATVGVVYFWFPWIFSIRWKVRQGPAWLSRERLAMESLIQRRLFRRYVVGRKELMDLDKLQSAVESKSLPSEAETFRNWKTIYEAARFGMNHNPHAEPVLIAAELKRIRKDLQKRLVFDVRTAKSA
jgi:hypothetical protein